ncbi:MAG TPA: poly-beta-1,6-N-acetyl-D-glucosamine N-deacetylase PgaB [Desulfobulbus sp.]|nr:poly-beta-1,6-N-acetyl-D-glucosamine N-deacetylase PgaB [Desulfobulbus sp.]
MENSDPVFDMQRISAAIIANLLLLLTLQPAWCKETRFIAIAYHDVVRSRDELASDAVTVDHLVDQFEWLVANNYHPVSIDDLLAARNGTRPLPSRAVLLCWDDGYRSFYDLVLPLLRAYRFPAVLALVGSWIRPDMSSTILYGNTRMPRSKFLSWPQLREIAASGLVEIASHSYNLHRGVLADRAGDKLPAVIAHIFDPVSGTYESDGKQFRRIYDDLCKNQAFLEKRLGIRPRVMVWPYGRYTASALAAAGKAGMDITLTLNAVPGNIANLREIGRVYPTLNPDLADFRNYLNPNISPPIRHFIKVRTEDLLDPQPGGEHRYSAFLDRLKALDPGMVTFEPVLRGKQGLEALFPNQALPLARDRLSRLTWHTAHRGGTDTFLWLSATLFAAPALADQATAHTFFRRMGQHAFTTGLLIDRPGLAARIIQSTRGKEPMPGIRFWNPSRQRRQRQRLLRQSRDPLIIRTMDAMEAFQEGQPFIEAGLVLPLQALRGLGRQGAACLLRYFDFLLIDGSKGNPAALDRQLRTGLAPLQGTGLLAKISLLLPRRPGTDPGQLMASLPRYNIINWGYAHDDFLHRLPAASRIRPLISKATNPFLPR